MVDVSGYPLARKSLKLGSQMFCTCELVKLIRTRQNNKAELLFPH